MILPLPTAASIAASALKKATAVVFLSGAGLGVDSGLPDFRGPEGFWRAYPPFKAMGYRFEQMSTPHWFVDDPVLAWGFFGHRYELYNSAEPHEGYSIMKRLGDAIPYFVVTSNVDGHFFKAGFPKDKVAEIHGSIHRLQAVSDERKVIFPATDSPELQNLKIDQTTFRALSELPHLPNEPDALARPNVMMFGDAEFDTTVQKEQTANFQMFKKRYHLLPEAGKHLVIIEIGAGKYVPSIRRLSESLLQEQLMQGRGATFIRVNPRDHKLDNTRVLAHTDPEDNVFIPMPHGGLEALTAIWEAYEALGGGEKDVDDSAGQGRDASAVISSLKRLIGEDEERCSALGCSESTFEGGGRLKLCHLCRTVRYCSRKCQITHWKQEHRAECSRQFI